MCSLIYKNLQLLILLNIGSVKRIPGKFYTFLSRGRSGRFSCQDVADDIGCVVRGFEELIDRIAKLGFRNPQFNLMYRGQNEDHQPQGSTSLFPSIWRLKPNLRRKRWELLSQATEELLELPSLHYNEKRHLRAIPERSWTVLQHYGIQTPLLDVTQSVRVATTFATENYDNDTSRNSNPYGYVYVFGMPNLFQGTTISLDDSLILLKLQSVCPESARRPHLQSDFLVGSYPNNNTKKDRYKNLTVRLVAKFRVPVDDGFWDIDQPLTRHAIYPRNDKFESEIEGIKEKIKY